MNWKYPAKLLLFGEYTVLSGSSAIAVPTQLFGSNWFKSKKNSTIYERYWAIVDALAKIELSVPIDSTLLEEDRENGVVLQSIIPFGQGLGSSGNICSAFYHRYYQKDRNVWNQDIIQDLVRLENFFHGQSSGLDPVCIFSQQAVLMRPAGIKKLDKNIDLSEFSFFLFDSETKRMTRSLVHSYKEKLKDKKFVKSVMEIEKRNELCIKWLIKNEPQVLFKYFRKLSKLQLEHWPFLIPDPVKIVWRAGIKSDDFYLKLCGAGGGGFFLGMAKNDQKIPREAIKVE